MDREDWIVVGNRTSIQFAIFLPKDTLSRTDPDPILDRLVCVVPTPNLADHD